VLAEINRDKKKRRKPYTPADFLPKLEAQDEDNEGQTPEQMLALCQMMFGSAKT
jgi:hypothetical protein